MRIPAWVHSITGLSMGLGLVSDFLGILQTLGSWWTPLKALIPLAGFGMSVGFGAWFIVLMCSRLSRFIQRRREENLNYCLNVVRYTKNHIDEALTELRKPHYTKQQLQNMSFPMGIVLADSPNRASTLPVLRRDLKELAAWGLLPSNFENPTIDEKTCEAAREILNGVAPLLEHFGIEAAREHVNELTVAAPASN